jgi:hypothetical protein
MLVSCARLSPLEQLARICGWRRGTVVVVLWAFFDESGEHGVGGALRRLTLGGFMAPWGEIERLCERWRTALDEECLSEFHMKDIASDEERFADWPEERQKRLTRFVDILCDHALEFGAFSYTSNRQIGIFRELYSSGLHRAYIDVASLCERTNERGQIVFAKTHEIKERLVGKAFDRLGWAEWLDGYAVQLSRCNPALQAAEIVARGMRRLMQDGGVTYSFSRVLMAASQPGKNIRFWPPDPFSATVALGHPWRALLETK